MLSFKTYTDKERSFLLNLESSVKTLDSTAEFSHNPTEVAQILVDWRLDTETIAAALLLMEATDIIKIPPDSRKLINEVKWLAVYHRYLATAPRYQYSYANMQYLLLEAATDKRSLIIWLANRAWLVTKQGTGRRAATLALEVYAPLADSLGMGLAKGLLEETAFEKLHPDTYHQLRQQVLLATQAVQETFEESTRFLEGILNDAHISVLQFDKRRKNTYSVYKKLPKTGSIDKMYDILAVRLLVPKVTDCYRALGVLNEQTEPMVHRIKDYIAIPKSNGYQSLHTTIKLPQGHVVEVQIRTPKMHASAETGVAAHFHYNQHKTSKAYQKGEVAPVFERIAKPQHIYVFSPNGDVYSLPDGAVALDFGFMVHSGLGLRTKAIKINGRIANLDSVLKNGDRVDIITNKQPAPKADWVKVVTLVKAKNKIRAFLRANQTSLYRARGEHAINQVLTKDGYSSLTEADLKRVVEAFNFQQSEQLLIAVGAGLLSVERVVRRLYPQTIKNKPQARAATKPGTVLINKLSGLPYRLAKCCNPGSGEHIIGYITRGFGVTVHGLACKNYGDDPLRLVKAEWA